MNPSATFWMQQAVELGLVDEVVPVTGAEAIAASRDLATKEALFTGISGTVT